MDDAFPLPEKKNEAKISLDTSAAILHDADAIAIFVASHNWLEPNLPKRWTLENTSVW